MNTQLDFIKEICTEEEIMLESLSHDYILRLSKDGRVRHIAGPYWDINSAAADRIACDKHACYILLDKNGIPAIEHELIFSPIRRSEWVGSIGTWSRTIKYFEEHNQKVVIKNNQGWGGQDVYFCDSLPSLEHAAHAIFDKYPNAAISPYYEIETEYRVFYLLGKAPFAYGKSKGEDWKHNLAQGAVAFQINDDKLTAKLETLAIRAAECIDIAFATVDIAELENGELSVMEINSGVQARYLTDQIPELRSTVKDIYTKAICHMLAPAPNAG